MGLREGRRLQPAWDAVAGPGGILLLIGLWTPVAGVVIAVAQLWIFLSQPFFQHRYPLTRILQAVLCAALAMLGPGAWSIDAGCPEENV
jgi:uncharacterized membrane protein YphA (DoxX/SURF4 family)